MRSAFTLVLALSLGAAPLVPAAAPLTEETGDAILKELEQIRALLQRMDRRDNAGRYRRRPAPAPASVSVANRPVLGRTDAPVTLVEFTDYQCPFCNRFFSTTLPQIKRRYIDTGKVKLVIKDLPLPFHPNAHEAAQAAHCAGEQAQFWPMHDVLFSNAKALEASKLPGYAATLALDLGGFEDCLASERHLDSIEADISEARTAGIRGTPSFVVGISKNDIVTGTRIVGAQPFSTFEQQIRAQLEAAGGADR